MKTTLLFTALLISACTSTDQAVPREDRIAYVGGLVWDGAAFGRRDIVVEGQRIVQASAESASRRVELNGGYVVPPFCEAHNHNLATHDQDAASIARYLREGIFYVPASRAKPCSARAISSSTTNPISSANGPTSPACARTSSRS